MLTICQAMVKSVFFCQKHSCVGFVVNDEDFCCDGIVRAEFERAFVGRLFLRMGDVLGLAVGSEPKDLQVVLLLNLHAVD